ncbi:MAG: tRNA (adenosine(37)-N6)-threonylcarbamoyltransferase complex ATPase subunit type 1 TsaE [Nitrospirae bacterium RBG_16_43_11]|nr:MAG: tRNA (adenosine(37)-N6)-threonylcarbamoyltransferase complex ATPase subunit type 1 TsaE [Nitrospirae bacterium RBG_16_43_11]
MTIKTTSVKETIAIGKKLGKLMSPGDVIYLTGELGAGKTCFVKGIAEGLGIRGKDITSPTFIIINEYKGKIPLYHIDLYRIGVIEDLRDIGMDEIVYGKGVTAIEWAERIKDVLPDERLDITLKWVDDKTRSIEIRAFGHHHKEILDKLGEGKSSSHG